MEVYVGFVMSSGTSTRLLQTCNVNAANCRYTNAPVHVRSSVIHATLSSAVISIIADCTTHESQPKFVMEVLSAWSLHLQRRDTLGSALRCTRSSAELISTH
jgi:hypothetical protein